jgi:methanogenic corrinoid protein MtbC1
LLKEYQRRRFRVIFWNGSRIFTFGKDIVKVLLKCYGFTVNDLGVDVPPDEFLVSTRELKPDIVGLSCLLNTSFEALRETIGLLRSKPPFTQPPPTYIIGGLVDEQVRKYAEADYWAADAMMGVRLCQLCERER